MYWEKLGQLVCIGNSLGNSERVAQTFPIHIWRFYWLYPEVILWFLFVEKLFLLFLVVGSFGWKNHQGPLKRLSKGLNGSVLVVSCPYIDVLCHDIRHRFLSRIDFLSTSISCVQVKQEMSTSCGVTSEQLKIKRQKV
jgi:hypothetical protein